MKKQVPLAIAVAAAVFTAGAGLTLFALDAPQLLGTLGALATLAMTGLAWMAVTASGRARAEARRMTQDLSRLAKVVERTANAVMITDLDLRITWVNEGFTRMYGHTLADALGQTPRQLLGTPYTSPQTRRVLEEAARTRSSCRVEVRNRTRDGRLLWIDTEVQPALDAKGEPAGFIEIALDITAQKETALQLAAAVRENEGLLTTIRQHAIVSVSDAQGLIIDVNQAFCDISQYRREELLGRNHSLLKSGEQSDEFWAAMWRTIAAGQPWRGAICNRARNGSLYWVDSIIAPFRGADGRIERYVSIRTDITASQHAAQHLRASERFLDRVGRIAGVGGWAFELATRSLHLADEVRRLLHLGRRAPLSARRVLSHCSRDGRRALTKAVRSALHLGTGWDLELALQPPDAPLIWVRVVGEVEHDAQGRALRLFGAAQDVTRRRELEAGLRQTNDLLTGVVENLPCGLAVFDACQQLVVHNQAFGELTGAPAAMLQRPGLTLTDLARHSAAQLGLDAEHSAAYLQRSTAAEPGPRRWESTLLGDAQVEVSSSPMPGGGMVRTYVDVSERKAREAEVRRADALLRGAIDTLDEAFVLYDPDDRLLLCNDRYRELFATSADLINPGTDFETIIRGGVARGQYPDAQGREAAWIAERLALHRAEFGHSVVKLDSGKWLRVIERRMPDGHVVGFRIDITDLMSATEAAQAASHAKSQFLANMSHEIRTPLNAILGMLTLLQRTPLSERQADYAGKAAGAARALMGLINDILDFSKIEAGMMRLDPQPFRPARLLDDVSALLSAQRTDDHAVALQLTLDPAVPPVLVGDAMRLLQVLTNLGGNALKFTERGQVALQIRLLGRTTDEAELLFEVQDTGIGIAPEHHERIFAGFSQAEASTTRRFGGTGLGLAISRRFVRMMGGDLQVDSRLGAGSRFHFSVRLPLLVAPSLPSLPLASTPPALGRLQGLRLLLAEDNANNRQVATELLVDEGAVVSVAPDGEAAVRAVCQGNDAFDAVLMDIQMPRMDGLQATRLIRADARFKALPIIAMSANVSAADITAALASGMSDHVGKPFDMQHLVQVLRHGQDQPAATPRPDATGLPDALQADAARRGIDLQGALARVMGRVPAYQRMVAAFVADAPALSQALQSAWDSGQADQLGHELHALKGLAGMLGARPLAQLAAEGEAAPASVDARWLQQLQGQIARSADDLAALAAHWPAPPRSVGPADLPRCRALLSQLARQLHEADMAALATSRELGQAWQDHPGLPPLQAAVDRLDFSAAAKFAQALAESLPA